MSKSGIRTKPVVMREYDEKELQKATVELAEHATKFAQEFAECDGDIFYSTYKELQNKTWDYEREKEISSMIKVGPKWDYENHVVGEYRYRDI